MACSIYGDSESVLTSDIRRKNQKKPIPILVEISKKRGCSRPLVIVGRLVIVNPLPVMVTPKIQ